MEFMSELQSVEQIVESVVKNTRSYGSILNSYKAQLGQMIVSCNTAIQGTVRNSYNDCVNNFALAQKKLEYAITLLSEACAAGENWISNHTNTSNSGPSTNPNYIGFTNEGIDLVNSTGTDVNTSAPSAFQRPDPSRASNPYVDLIDYIDNYKISYLPFSTFAGERSEKEIIERLGGGDQTDGSCSSLAFAYCGNRAGYDVLDFRDGNSREFFSLNKHIQRIAELPNLDSTIEYGKDDEECANRLMDKMEEGKEYYLSTGQHAAIVRLNNGRYEYLELQQPKELNRWYPLHPMSLIERFGCGVNTVEYPNILIEVQSLADCSEFLDLLGYINTSEFEQNKGDEGYAK